MASLRDMVSEYQDDLRNGIAWLAFWHEGRSWQAEAFHLDLDDTLYPEDRARLAEIQAADPRAIVVNGYYSGYLGEEMNVAELAAGVRHHYDNGLNNIAPFMEAHSDELPPEVLEEAREKARAAGLPFYERPYRGDDIDPYTYDGHISIEDYQLMQKLMEQDRERSEPMSEVFSILLHNRQRYEQGNEGLWFSLPTTTEKLQEALREIGISADNPQDFFLYDYRSPQERTIKLPRDLVLSADVDELNFLAARLEKLDAAELAELNAALTSPQSDFHSIGQIIDYPDNVDYYVHLPDVTGMGQLGDYYLNRSGMVDMPEEWKAGIFLPRFGLHIANTEHGVFTDYGYLVKSGDEWQRVHEGQPVPEEYRVMAYPAPEILREEAQTRQAAAPTAEAPAQRQVIPIILNSKNSADRMKEITDRLETGIMDLFESGRFQAYLDTMARFHNYSFNNTILIAMQGGQLVAGYNKWRDEFHRNVKKGEKGIKIFAPAPYKVKKEVPKLDEQGQPVRDKDGNPVTEQKEIQVPAFKIVSVFDVSQTEGEPLPTLGVEELTGDVERYQDFFKALEQTSPVPMAFEDIPGGSHGYYHLTEKRIAIQENMSELQTLKTAIHEIAHAKLHAIDPEAPVTEQADRPDSRTREVQAESVAYTVCQHYGLDTSDYSFGYVAGWSSGKDLKELRASLETIRATAHELITTIDGHLAELQQQRQAQQTVEQAAEQPAPDSVFSKLPPEQQQEMADSVKAMLQILIDADVKSTGEVTQGTLDAIQTQGFVLSGDGTLQRAEAQPEPWNGMDGLLNNKPFLPEATPTERANALIDWAERGGQRMGNGERRLIVEYAEAVDNTDKVIALINELCEHGYEMQHGHVDEMVKSRIDREIAEAKAAQQPALDPTAEPVVTILFTESPHLEIGQQMPLHEADALFARLDAEHQGGGYDKTDFRIDFTFQGEPHSYSGRQDFGDRDGSLIEHIREYQTFYLNDEKWKDHLTRQGGPEAWAEDHASREAFLTEIIPYMELHCNLSRLEQEAQTRLASSDTLTPEETAYYGALADYAMECRPLLNHGEPLPEMPKLTDFDQSLQGYKAQVEAEIAQEAADAGMTVEEYAAAGYEAPAAPEPETAPAQEVTSDAEPQAAPAKTLTELQEKALEIADRYKDLPLQGKIDIIAQAFGCKTGEIRTSPCTGKWRGTSDMSIHFDNGASLFIGNHLTPKTKTVKVQTEYVNRALVQYNPEIVKATKEAALPALLRREAKDNEIAAQKGLKPYTLLNVEFNDGADEKTGGYMGWYYVTLAVDGKICTHLETGLSHDIADGKVSDTHTRADYFTAGALKEANVDYVFNNVGFSSASGLYALPLREDVLERAEKTLAERTAAQPEQDTFSIYQIPAGTEGRDFRYRPYEELQAAGLAVDKNNYALVYTAPLDGKTSLEDIYRTFNADDRPADFRGHSLSVSDVVVLNRGGKEEAHYCDSFGFTPVPEFFLQREKQLAPQELLTGESIQTPRGNFLVTDMSREQLEAAGYGFHHQSEDGKYLIMGNGTDAFAIPAQQESPIKAAEMTTEQNYNMIDGPLNNAPTMSELEARAKAGEQISLFDVAEAAKAEAKKPKQSQRPAQKQKKPSIRAQLKAAKEEQHKKPPQREKSKELEV